MLASELAIQNIERNTGLCSHIPHCTAMQRVINSVQCSVSIGQCKDVMRQSPVLGQCWRSNSLPWPDLLSSPWGGKLHTANNDNCWRWGRARVWQLAYCNKRSYFQDWVTLSKNWMHGLCFPRFDWAAPRVFVKAKPQGNPEEQPCQPEENPVQPIFTESAQWTNSVSKSQCPCLVCATFFCVFFKRIFSPIYKG